MSENAEVNKMGNITISELFYPIVFVLMSIVAEMVNFVYLGFGILPKYIIFDLAFLLFGAGLIYLLPKKWMKITLFYIFFGLQIVLNCVNVTMNNVFGDILSLDMLKLGNEAVSAFSFEFLDFFNIFINLLLVAISILIIIGINKRLSTKTLFTKKSKYVLMLVVIMSLWFCCGSFMLLGRGGLQEVEASTDLYIVNSDVYLWDSLFLKSEAFKKFGTFGFYYKSIENLVAGNDNVNVKDLKSFVNQGKDSHYITEFSNISQGDNLIVIMLESFEWFAIDPIYTPTLYEMRTETGYSMENFYGRNKTNVSEDISILGSMPRNSMLIDYYNKVGINVPYSLPNLFKSQDDGVKANYFHGYLETFYNRDIVNVALGFDDVIALEDTDVPYKSPTFNHWVKDSDFINANMNQFVPNVEKPFFSFYTTIGTHGSYDNELDAYKEYYDYFDAHVNEYREYLKSTDYIFPEDEIVYKHLRNYKSAAMDTDRMVKSILDKLEELGKLDSTTIVMFADHNCYYHDTTNYLKGISKTDYSNIELYNIPFMIYNDDITPKQDYTFCNTYDIYPTICDMFGFGFNQSLMQGHSIFSSDISDSVFVSFLNGMYNDKFYTNNVVNVNKLKKGVTNAEMNNFQLNLIRFYLKQQKIEDIFKINYFKNYE